MIPTAVTVFVIEAIRYWWSGVASSPLSTSASPDGLAPDDLAVADRSGADAGQPVLGLSLPDDPRELGRESLRRGQEPRAPWG